MRDGSYDKDPTYDGEVAKHTAISAAVPKREALGLRRISDRSATRQASPYFLALSRLRHPSLTLEGECSDDLPPLHNRNRSRLPSAKSLLSRRQKRRSVLRKAHVLYPDAEQSRARQPS